MLVGSSASRISGCERARDRDALTLAARARGVLLRDAPAVRPHRAQQVVHALLDLVALDDPVDAQRPLDDGGSSSPGSATEGS
jgi:hypothetical protein